MASWGFYDVFGATDITTFRNHLPLTKASQAQEEESGGQPLPPTSNRYHGEASLQVNGEGWNLTPSLRSLSGAKASHQDGKKANSNNSNKNLKTKLGDFHDGPVVKTPALSAEGAGSIPGDQKKKVYLGAQGLAQAQGQHCLLSPSRPPCWVWQP